MLIDDLKAIQDRAGYLPEAELLEYAERCNVPLYQIEAVASFYPFFRREPPARVEVRVCRDLSCHLRGAPALRQRLEAAAGGEFFVDGCSCLGLCDRAPALLWNDHPIEAAALGQDPFGDPDLVVSRSTPSPPLDASIDPYAPLRGAPDMRAGMPAPVRLHTLCSATSPFNPKPSLRASRRAASAAWAAPGSPPARSGSSSAAPPGR